MTESFSVLIVEDNALIAAHMVCIVEDAGGTVLGPAKSAASALLLIDAFEPPDAALLDINITDGLVYPVATRLTEIGCRFAFVSAVRPMHIPSQFEGIEILSKPADTKAVTEWLLN
ncbi:response regulator [Devosia aurantiaca]|uniref:Response regulator n=1 Tax=Devosia aurantiaca TaxID=2714858 RepID=A0A6M1SUW2_9HYPH|nr:response regulator [Devosia aurantiaca]NGP18905.1 response regulator [Devosia aurantiaca]